MSKKRKRLGDWGESVAAAHLEAHGYRILARNWRCPYGEIDLVVRKKDVVAFVEVKTRRGRSHGAPEQALTPRKAQTLITVAQMYLGEHNLDADWQIDLVAVELDKHNKLVRCEHLPNMVRG